MTPMIGEGTYAKCYLLDGGIVKKVYKNRIPNNQKETIGVVNDTYVFAHFMDEKNKYTLLKYVEGIPFLKVVDGDYIPFADPYLVDFEASLKKLYKDTDKLSSQSIFLEDSFGQNILFGEDGFKVIDTDMYFYMNDAEKTNQVFYWNTMYINEGLFDALCCSDKLKRDIEFLFINDSKEMSDLYRQTFEFGHDNKIFKYFLMELKRMGREYSGKIERFNELRNSLESVVRVRK